jgi:hypothetical protein
MAGHYVRIVDTRSIAVVALLVGIALIVAVVVTAPGHG